MKEWNSPYNPFNSLKILMWKKHLEACAKGEYLIPMMVDIDPSPMCNFSCGHCNANDVIKKELKNLPGDHYLKLADFLINWRKDDYERIHSSCISGGGESMMNPITPELCEKLNNGGIEVGLITNGSLFNFKNIPQMIKNCRWIGVSMDAATSGTFGKIKGVKGDIFNKVIENIKLLVKEVEKQNVNNGLCYKFLLTPVNYMEIYDAVKLAKSLGVHDFHLRPVGYEGVSKLKGQSLEYTSEMLDIINKQMDEAMNLETDEFKVYGIRHKFTPNFQPKKNFSKCWTIPLLPTFGADGIVHYCFDIRARKGTEMCKHYPDVTEISRFWNSQKHKDMVNNFDVRSCTKCTFSQYNEVVEKVFIQDNMYRNFI